MTAWQQGQAYPGQSYPGQGAPPPPGFFPEGGYSQPGYPPGNAGYPQQPGGYPQPGTYPQQPGYPQQGGLFSGQGPTFPQTGFKPPDMGGNYGGANYGGEYGESAMNGAGNAFGFSEKSIRLAFIRKVYSILFIQLSVTLGIISLFTFHLPAKNFVANHRELWLISMIVMVVCMLVMACCGDVRRKAPMNFVFLGIFTLAESFMLSCVVVSFSAKEVLLAVGVCAAVTLALTLFAFQTKIDFTIMGGCLFAASIVLMIFGIVLIFWSGKTATLIYGCFGALLFSFYIIYDTQMMMGDNHKYSLSPEEYIFAALNLYLDITNLFLYILTIISASRD